MVELCGQHKAEFGWATGIKTLERLAKVSGKPVDDPRLTKLIAFMSTALAQGNMSSTSRTGVLARLAVRCRVG